MAAPSAQRFKWELRLRLGDRKAEVSAAAGSENCVAVVCGSVLHVLTHEGVRETSLPVSEAVTDLAISLDEQWFAYCSGTTVGVTTLDSSRGSVHRHARCVKKICWASARAPVDPIAREERHPPHLYFADETHTIYHFVVKRDVPRVVLTEKQAIASLECFGPALLFSTGGVAKLFNTTSDRVIVFGTNRRGGGARGVACLPSVVLPNGVDSDEGMPSPGMGVYVARTSGRVWIADTAGVVHKAVTFPPPPAAETFGMGAGGGGDPASPPRVGAGAVVHHLVSCHYQSLICAWSASCVAVLDVASGAMTALTSVADGSGISHCVVSGEYVYVVKDGDLYFSPLPCSAPKISGALGIDPHRQYLRAGTEGSVGGIDGTPGVEHSTGASVSDVKSMASISSNGGWEWFRHRVMKSSASRRGTSTSALDDTSVATDEKAAAQDAGDDTPSSYLDAPGLPTASHTPTSATDSPVHNRHRFICSPPPPSVQVRFPGGGALTVIKPPGLRGHVPPSQEGVNADSVLGVPPVLLGVPGCGCAAREWIGSYVMMLCETPEVFRDAHIVYQQQLQACSSMAFLLRNDHPCAAEPRCSLATQHQHDEYTSTDLEDNLLPYIDARWCAAGGLLSQGSALTELDSQVVSLVAARDVDVDRYPHALNDAAVYLARLPHLLATNDVNGIIYMTLLANRSNPIKWGLVAEACRVLAERHPHAAHRIIGDTAPAPRPMYSEVWGGKSALRTLFSKPPAFLDAVDRASRTPHTRAAPPPTHDAAKHRKVPRHAQAARSLKSDGGNSPSSSGSSAHTKDSSSTRSGAKLSNAPHDGSVSNVGRPNANTLGITGNLLDEVLLVLLCTCERAKADPDLVYFVFDRLATQQKVQESPTIASFLTAVASQPHVWASYAPGLHNLLQARGLVDQLVAFFEARVRAVAVPGYGAALLRLLVTHRRADDLTRLLRQNGGRSGFAAALTIALNGLEDAGDDWGGLRPGEVTILACSVLGTQDALSLLTEHEGHPGWLHTDSGCGACLNALCATSQYGQQRQAAVRRAMRVVDDANRKLDVVPSVVRVVAGEEGRRSPRRRVLRDCQTAVKVSDPVTTTSVAPAHWGAVLSPEHTCPVCKFSLASASLPVIVLPCGHSFHQSCLHTAECPVCAQRDVVALLQPDMPVPPGGATVTTITDTVTYPHPEAYMVDVRY